MNPISISNLQIEGFRRLRKIDLSWRPLSVVIGPNGVGKSSLLQTFSLLGACANGNLGEWLADNGGLPSLLTRGRAQELKLRLDFRSLTDTPIYYQLSLAARGLNYTIKQEELAEQRDLQAQQPLFHIQATFGNVKYFDPAFGRPTPPTWQHDPQEAALSQTPPMFQEPETLRQTLQQTTFFSPLPLSSTSPARLPQTIRTARFPNNLGDNLVSYLYSLREENTERYELLESTLKTAFGSFEKLNLPIVGTNQLSLSWKDTDFPMPFSAHELSEGTLRFLWLASLLLSPNLPPIIVIDEPELSLHPELLSLLADLLRDAAMRCHVVVATHSDRLVRFLTPEEVLICDATENGETTLTWGDSLDLEKWLRDYTLDQLWTMNVLGGRP